MILWVDDNQELRRAVAEHLKSAGHRVAEAGSAEEALEKVDQLERDEALDLLLADYRLPGRTGLELAAALRDRPATSLVPVLMVTSNITLEELGDWPDDPAFAVLQKPFDLVDLYAAVSAFLTGETPRTGYQPSGAEASHPSAHPATHQLLESADEATDESAAARRPAGDPASPPWVRLALAAGLALAVFAVAWPWLGSIGLVSGTAPDLPPDLPEAPTEDVRRSGTIQGLEPFGPVAGLPDGFAWRPVAPGVSYRIQVDDVAGKTLWRGETRDSELTLPVELTERLLPLAAYYWHVEAFDADGGLLAASDTVRFRIVDTDSGPTDQGPADSDPTDSDPRSSP